MQILKNQAAVEDVGAITKFGKEGDFIKTVAQAGNGTCIYKPAQLFIYRKNGPCTYGKAVVNIEPTVVGYIKLF